MKITTKSLLIAFLSLIVFVICLISIHTQQILFSTNTYIHQHFIHLRETPSFAYKFLSFFSLAADKYFLVPPAGLIALLLLIKRCNKLCFIFCGLMVSVITIALTLKHTMMVARPPGLAIPLDSFSFPSGHSVLAVSFYGFITYLIASNLPQQKSKMIYSIGILFILLQLIARLFLNSHWLLDILGGASLSLFLTSLSIYLIEKYNIKHTYFSRSTLLTTITIGFMIASMFHGKEFYFQELNKYILITTYHSPSNM